MIEVFMVEFPFHPGHAAPGPSPNQLAYVLQLRARD